MLSREVSSPVQLCHTKGHASVRRPGEDFVPRDKYSSERSLQLLLGGLAKLGLSLMCRPIRKSVKGYTPIKWPTVSVGYLLIRGQPLDDMRNVN